MILVLTTRFRRSYKRLTAGNQRLIDIINERIRLFSANPHQPILKDHALSGHLRGYRSFVAGYDLRILYRMEQGEAILFDIGSHDRVYR